MKRIAGFLVLLSMFLILGCGESSTKSSESAQPVASGPKPGEYAVGKIVFKYKPAEGEADPGVIRIASGKNGWNPADDAYKLEKQADGTYALELEFKSYTIFTYKYTFNGEWTIKDMSTIESKIEPKPTKYVDDGFGGKNAQIKVVQ